MKRNIIIDSVMLKNICPECRKKLAALPDIVCGVGFGQAYLGIDKRISIDLEKFDPPLTLEQLNERFADQLKDCKEAEIVLNGPLAGATLELNKEDGLWYFVEMNKGFA